MALNPKREVKERNVHLLFFQNQFQPSLIGGQPETTESSGALTTNELYMSVLENASDLMGFSDGPPAQIIMYEIANQIYLLINRRCRKWRSGSFHPTLTPDVSEELIKIPSH